EGMKMVQMDDLRVVIFGGLTAGVATGVDDTDIFDPSTNLISAAADLTAGAGAHTSAVVKLAGNKLLTAGGVTDAITSAPVNTAYSDDADANLWTATTNPLPAARSRMAIVRMPISGRIFVHGGFSYPGSVQPFHNDLWEY